GRGDDGVGAFVDYHRGGTRGGIARALDLAALSFAEQKAELAVVRRQDRRFGAPRERLRSALRNEAQRAGVEDERMRRGERGLEQRLPIPVGRQAGAEQQRPDPLVVEPLERA